MRLNKITYFLLFLLFWSCSTFNLAKNLPFQDNIEKSYKWNDGPWLTFFENPSDSIRISWTTEKAEMSAIYLGQEHDSMKFLKISDEKRKIHHAEIDGLQPETEYYYQVVFGAEENERSGVFSFLTASINPESYTVTILGDLQPKNEITRNRGIQVAEAIKAGNPDFVVQLGDVSEWGGNQKYWHFSLNQITFYGSLIPSQFTVGNHDYYGDESSNFSSLFPNNNSSESHYYSFTYGDSYFLILDNFDDNGKMSSIQEEWAEKDIIKHKEYKWKFIVFHNVLITTATSKPDYDFQKWLFPFADKNQVDAVFFGHDHQYEHWYYTYGENGFVYNEDDKASGHSVHYFCSGGGGTPSEIDYGLLTHKAFKVNLQLYNLNSGQYEEISYLRLPWSGTEAAVKNGIQESIHYYQTDESPAAAWAEFFYGYDYGEQTLHYINIDIDEDKAVVTAFYPDGLIVGEHSGANIQQFFIWK